ncbi:MAG: nucleoside-diphosphate sugar epimerase, partial [Candidatus Cloacimonetes bacterium]|nr:nucleoside-diphosphate sugar epimerase [Candidatus Cloacimonadota bacterium]
NTEEITIEDLALKIKEMTKSPSKIEYIPYSDAYEEGFDDMRRRIPDLTKIKEYINYNPKFNLDNIIERVIDYYAS